MESKKGEGVVGRLVWEGMPRKGEKKEIKVGIEELRRGKRRKKIPYSCERKLLTFSLAALSSSSSLAIN